MKKIKVLLACVVVAAVVIATGFVSNKNVHESASDLITIQSDPGGGGGGGHTTFSETSS